MAMTEEKKDGPDLEQVGFKPGKGMVYRGAKGRKFVAAQRLTVEENSAKNQHGIVDKRTGRKVHMSKKQRRKFKAYMEAQKNEQTS